jgi:hypothetical protein
MLFQSEKVFEVKKPVHPTFRIGRIDGDWMRRTWGGRRL